MSHLFMRRSNLESLPEQPQLPEGYALREATVGDTIALAVLMQAAFDDKSWTPGRVRLDLLEAADVKLTWVIDQELAPVATASVRLLPQEYPGSGYLHWVASHPAHRGQRLGRAVTLACLHSFRAIGCKDVVLETQDTRLAAIKLYRSLGFVPEYREPSHAERWLIVLSDLANAINL